MYDYESSVRSDIVDYLNENYERKGEYLTIEEQQELLDNLRTEDSVTGNASGSYTFSTYQAHENLLGNEQILQEVIDQYCIDMGEHWQDYEYLDVSIRCYLLNQVLQDALTDRYAQRIGTEEEYEERTQEEEIQKDREEREKTEKTTTQEREYL